MSKHRDKDTKLIWKLNACYQKKTQPEREEERKGKDEEREEESKKELGKKLETVKAALSKVENGISITDESVDKRKHGF